MIPLHTPSIHAHAMVKSDQPAPRERSVARDVTPASTSRSPAARLSPRSERSSVDRLGAQLAIAEAHLLFVQGAPLEGGGREPQLKPICKGRDPRVRRRADRARGRTGVRGARDPPPGAPRARRAKRAAYEARGGMGFPPWGFLIWWGRLGRGGPGGETKAGEARRALCPPQTTAIRAGGG